MSWEIIQRNRLGLRNLLGRASGSRFFSDYCDRHLLDLAKAV